MRVAAFAAAVALAYAILIWATWAHRDITRLIVVGQTLVDSRHHPPLHITSGGGYDGQFYYRFAIDPFHLDGHVAGISVDSALRRQRIFYSLLAWVLSAGGHVAVVPWSLVAVNILAVGALAYFGAAFAESTGHDPRWGLAFPAFAGFVCTIARDLTELTSSALLVGALAALQRRRPVLATMALALAVLTRETAVIVVVAVAAPRLWQMVRRRARPGVADLPWLLPAAVFAGWQLAVHALYGQAPITAEGGNNNGTPGSAFVHSLGRWVTHLRPSTLLLLVCVLSLAALVIVTLAGTRGRTATVPPYLPIGLVLAAALAASLSTSVWNDDPFELRTLAEVHLLGVATLLAARRLPTLAVYSAVAVPCQLAVVAFVVTG
jgi:hypothetical protein